MGSTLKPTQGGSEKSYKSEKETKSQQECGYNFMNFATFIDFLNCLYINEVEDATTESQACQTSSPTARLLRLLTSPLTRSSRCPLSSRRSPLSSRSWRARTSSPTSRSRLSGTFPTWST